MSGAPRVNSPTFGPAATTRVGAARNVASVAFPKIEELSGSGAMGSFEQTVQYDESYQQSDQRNQQEQPKRRPGFSDFTSYAPVSYIDEVIAAFNWDAKPAFFPVEAMRGVSRYETNMRVISGVNQVSGESYNRLF